MINELQMFIPYIYGDYGGGWVKFGSVCASLDEAQREQAQMKEAFERNDDYCFSCIHPIKINLGTY